MRCLSKRSEVIFHRLTEGMVKLGDHQQWNNANGSFMAVCIEIIAKTALGPLVSITHYFTQNGDMMRDPDIVFWVDADRHVYPLSFRQDSLGLDQEAAVFENGQWNVKPKMQADITRFANQWMLNIEEQQCLGKKTNEASDSRIWKCPECGHTETIDQDWLADHGEPVCSCDCDMQIQTKGKGI